jgi:hypothetical protein
VALGGSEEKTRRHPIIRLGLGRQEFDPRVLVTPVALDPPLVILDPAGHTIDRASLAKSCAEWARLMGRLESPLESRRFPGHRVFLSSGDLKPDNQMISLLFSESKQFPGNFLEIALSFSLSRE